MTSTRKDVRIKRKTADRLLNGIVERVKKINSSEQYVYGIRRLVVFGSYVNDLESDSPGDPDIGFETYPKYQGDELRQKHLKKSMECRDSDMLVQIGWAEIEVFRRLRNRSAYISLYRIGTLEDQAIFSKEFVEIPIE